jgi:putative resolvase
MFLTSKQTTKVLGVHANTLRRWASQGKIKFIFTPAHQRLYDVDDFLGHNSAKRRICYCRVSSSKQRDDLERQVNFMQEKFPQHELITDIGSGLNFKRKGFRSILESICSGMVSEVVVAHRDRLCRFGTDLIRHILEYFGGKLVVLNETKCSPQEELVQDLLSIITVFSCRVHGLRKYKRVLKEDQVLSEPSPESNAT